MATQRILKSRDVKPADSRMSVYRDLLDETRNSAMAFLEGLPDRPVGRPVDYADLLDQMGGPLPEEGLPPLEVVRELIQAADPAIVSTPGPRYFGFVVGGSVPAAMATEMMTAVWDQNAFCYVQSPAASVAEEVSRKWLLEMLGLPADWSLGFVTGGTMANFTCIAAGRHALYRHIGWDVEKKGLIGAPNITVVTSDESHASVFASLQMLGLGHERVVRVETDEQGRMKPADLNVVLSRTKDPVLVCAQAGNVNSGSFDPLTEIAGIVQKHKGWLHVDGAFGMWAAASAEFRYLTKGAEHADSVSMDGHKWLNVPYDCGLAFVRDREAHHSAMTMNAPYYVAGPETVRENHNWVPEASRRARGFATYAALRSMGRKGLGDLVERCCRLAKRMADQLAARGDIQVLNDVVLNQVMVRFLPKSGHDIDGFTANVIQRVQEDGTCWAGGTTWHGMHAMRFSVSNWSTTEQDIEITVQAITRCLEAAHNNA